MIPAILTAVFIIAVIAVVLIKFIFPIISGYAAKNLASALFVQKRKLDEILKDEFSHFPFSLTTHRVDDENMQVTSSVMGLGAQIAKCTKGFGATLQHGKLSQPTIEFTFEKPLSTSDSPWPMGDKVDIKIPPQIDAILLTKAVENMMHAKGKNRPDAKTRGVLILYDGKIIAEKYAPGFDEHSLHLSWSIAKSITAALIGILVKQGKLNIELPAPIAAWNGTPKEAIKVKHLLQMTSGIDFSEIYTRPSNATKMLFKEKDMGNYAGSLPLKHKPGTYFSYSSGSTNILSMLIRQIVGEDAYPGFPYKALFHKIGAYSFVHEQDQSGTYVGSSYLYGTLRDYARFGLLYYQQGNWNGEQLLPESWVQQTASPSQALNNNQYGYQFWLNGVPPRGKASYPDAPEDTYLAHGYGGQAIFIIPSKKIIALRFGFHEYDENAFLKDILSAVKH